MTKRISSADDTVQHQKQMLGKWSGWLGIVAIPDEDVVDPDHEEGVKDKPKNSGGRHWRLYRSSIEDVRFRWNKCEIKNVGQI